MVALLARATGRVYVAKIALFLSALLMVLWNPRLLIFDLSFQLSFCATAGLIYLEPWLAKYVRRWSASWGLRDLFTTTVAAQLAVTPLLIFRLGNLSILGLIANLFVLPIVPLTMVLVAITSLIGSLAPFLALPSSYLAYFLLAYILKVVAVIGGLPWSAISF
jgi:competence protein ComEC